MERNTIHMISSEKKVGSGGHHPFNFSPSQSKENVKCGGLIGEVMKSEDNFEQDDIGVVDEGQLK